MKINFENVNWETEPESIINIHLKVWANGRGTFLHHPGIWKQLFEEQNGCCAICGKHQAELSQTLAIDHNHITGKVRGLLCSACNLFIGRYDSDKGVEKMEKNLHDFKGTANRLEKAVEYTKKHAGG